MNKTTLDSYESCSAASRALASTRKFVEDAAKHNVPPSDIAAELKRREDAHVAWSEEVRQYNAMCTWWEELTANEKGSKVGKIAEQAIEQLGKTLSRVRVVGY